MQLHLTPRYPFIHPQPLYCYHEDKNYSWIYFFLTTEYILLPTDTIFIQQHPLYHSLNRNEDTKNCSQKWTYLQLFYNIIHIQPHPPSGTVTTQHLQSNLQLYLITWYYFHSATSSILICWSPRGRKLLQSNLHLYFITRYPFHSATSSIATRTNNHNQICTYI